MYFYRIGSTEEVEVNVGQDISTYTSATVYLTPIYDRSDQYSITGTINVDTISFSPSDVPIGIYSLKIIITDGTNTIVFPDYGYVLIAIW